MRILQITAAYKPAYIYGGPTMSVAMLCEQLAKTGIDVDVFTTTANGLAELDITPNQSIKVDGVNVIYFKRVTKDHSHLSPALLMKTWRSTPQYDIVHIHAWWNLVSVLGCIVAVMRSVPVVVSARGTLSPYSFQNKNQTVKALIHRFIGKPILKRCHIHATSPRERDAVLSIINPKSSSTIPNFVKLPVYHPSKAAGVSTPIKLIFFSRIEEKKGLDILLEALTQVNLPFHLTIAGDGNETYVQSLKLQAANTGIFAKITWLGFINDDKFDILQQHDLFILPSYDENFGNAVIESLSVGTPVLISEQVGLASYVAKNKLGWLCQTNAESLAETINKIITLPKELSRIREQAPGIIYNDFNDSSIVEKYIGLYQKIALTN